MRNHRHDQTQVLQPCQTHLWIRKEANSALHLQIADTAQGFCHRRRIVAGSSHGARPSRCGHLSVLPPEILRLPRSTTPQSIEQSIDASPSQLGTALPQTSVDLRWNPLEPPQISQAFGSIKSNGPNSLIKSLPKEPYTPWTFKTIDLAASHPPCCS